MESNIKYKIQFKGTESRLVWEDYDSDCNFEFENVADALEEIKNGMKYDFLLGNSGKWAYRIVPFVVEG